MLRRTFLSLLLLVCLPVISISQQRVRIEGSTLIKDKIAVKPGQYKWWTRTFNTSVRVTGRFDAEGGVGDDIECFVMDDKNFKNWQSGHRVPAYYNSGLKTTEDIELNLAPGTYHFVFSNKSSPLYQRVVDVNIAYKSQ
jgi:hypothetical protein